MNLTIATREEITDLFATTYTAYAEKETEFKDDPLVLSVSLKEIWTRTEQYYSIEDERVLANVTDEIRAVAENIRKYYSKKYFWQNLKSSNRMSDYRQRVSYLLENRVRTCKDKDIGIYFKLPWFYEEDIVYEDFKKQYTVDNLPRLAYNDKPIKAEITLKFLKTTFSYQRKRKIERFWFTDDLYLYGLELETGNPLLTMFKDILATKQEHTFESYISQDRVDQMYFYKLFQFTFKKENNNA